MLHLKTEISNVKTKQKTEISTVKITEISTVKKNVIEQLWKTW